MTDLDQDREQLRKLESDNQAKYELKQTAPGEWVATISLNGVLDPIRGFGDTPDKADREALLQYSGQLTATEAHS